MGEPENLGGGAKCDRLCCGVFTYWASDTSGADILDDQPWRLSVLDMGGNVAFAFAEQPKRMAYLHADHGCRIGRLLDGGFPLAVSALCLTDC